jgi:hypothetical protein
MDWDRTCKFTLLVVERGTPCPSIPLAREGIHPASPYFWWWKGIHPACLYCQRWTCSPCTSIYRWHWKGIHTPCKSTLLVVERNTPCMAILQTVERICPTARPYCWWLGLVYREFFGPKKVEIINSGVSCHSCVERTCKLFISRPCLSIYTLQ